MVNIAVFVSGSGTNLQALIDACANNEINGSIKLVVSNRKKAYGLERARLSGIKAEWIKDNDLIIKRLDNADLPAEEVAIEVIDVSKTGVGFNCTVPLEIGAVYEAHLTLWTKEVIHAFIEIVRIIKEDDTFKYGGIFIGMPEMDAARIMVYDTVNETL